MTTKYIAKHDGHTWTRTSKNRTYTHAVISAVNIATERAARIVEIQGYVKKGWEGYDQAYADGAGARFDEKINNYPKSSDGLSYYVIHGWAGRLDLAQKLASTTGIILAAEVVAA